MNLSIKPLRQTTEFGCLAACYAMVRNFLFEEKPFTKDDESHICKEAYKSETGFNEHFYLSELYKKGSTIKILVETPYMVAGYEQLNSELHCRIPIEYALIGLHDYESLLKKGYILITLIDLWFIDMIIHYPHYVIVHGIDKHSLFLVDPKYGKEIRFSKEAFQRNLQQLKSRLGYSLVIFAIKKASST